MYRFAASALCSAMLALVGAVSAQPVVGDAAPSPVSAVSPPEAQPLPPRVAQSVRKPAEAWAAKQAQKAKQAKKTKQAKQAKKAKQARKARQLAAQRAKARAKQQAAVRAAKAAQRKVRASKLNPPMVFSPPAAALAVASAGASAPEPAVHAEQIQVWPARVVIGATVTAFSPQGDVGSAQGIDNGQRAKLRFNGGGEASCQLMLVPRDREIPPGSTGSALLSCQSPFQVRKDAPTFTLYAGGRLVGEGNLSVLSEP